MIIFTFGLPKEALTDAIIFFFVLLQKQRIKKLENTVISKEVLLTESKNKLQKSEEQIQQLEQQHFELILQRRDFENETMNINQVA